MSLVEDLVFKALAKVGREHFLPYNVRKFAKVNQALPISHGQTNSQPIVVAFMLEELQLEKDQTALDIGAGSGWTTALLAEIVGPKGTVMSVEEVAELCRFGRENVERLGYKNVEFRCGDWRKVVKDPEKFDRIQAVAAASKLPDKLLKLLKSPGRLVLPVKNPVSGNHTIKTVIKDERG